MRGSSFRPLNVAAHQAHNLKVTGLNPAPVTQSYNTINHLGPTRKSGAFVVLAMEAPWNQAGGLSTRNWRNVE